MPSELPFAGDDKECRPTPHFTLFPDLPTELRLKIWFHTFPNARNAYIGLPFRYEVQREIRPRNPAPEPVPRPKLLPISMWINKESRTETLRHYSILDPTSLNLQHEIGRSPLCLNPARDYIYLEYINLHWAKWINQHEWTIKDHLQLLTEYGASHMNKIQSLHIQNVGLAQYRFYLFQVAFNRVLNEGQERKELDIYYSIIRHFRLCKRSSSKLVARQAKRRVLLGMLYMTL